MGIAILRAMWRDWGFAPSLLAQARQFLELARNGDAQEGHIRSSILFSVMSFEAYWGEVVRNYIHANRATLDPAKVAEVELQRSKKVGIQEQLNLWPRLLIGNRLDTTTNSYRYYLDFKEYRNLLVHGRITDRLPSGRLAQEVEVVQDAELSIQTASDMIRAVSAHFGIAPPEWA